MNTQKINTAITSYGMSGKVFHGPLLKTNPGFKVTKIYERTTERSKQLFPNAQIVRSYDEVINDPDIELVIVNTPDHLHFEMVKAALELGKHVVVEKPFTQTVAQADELIELAKQKDLILSVFHNRRLDGDFLTVRKVVNQNFLGRLVEFESHFDRYRNFIQDSWKEKDGFGTGNLYNLGPHMIDQALVLFGFPKSVFADIRKMRDGVRVDDYYDINLIYPELKVTLKSSYLVREAGPRYILNGTGGSFLKWGIDPQEEALKKGMLPDNADWGKEDIEYHGLLNATIKGVPFREKIETEAGNYPLFYHNIFDSIRNNKELLVKPEEARDVIRIIELAYLSAKEGRVLSFEQDDIHVRE